MNKRQEFWVELRKTDAFKFNSPSDATAFQSNPGLEFSFDPENADDSNETLQVRLEGKPISADDFVIVDTQLNEDVVTIQYRVKFKVSVDAEFSEDDFDAWAENEGGWACAYSEPEDIDCEPADFAGETYLGSKDEYGQSFNDPGDTPPAKAKVEWPF